MRWWRDPIDPKVVARLEGVALRLEQETERLREYVQARRGTAPDQPRGFTTDVAGE